MAARLVREKLNINLSRLRKALKSLDAERLDCIPENLLSLLDAYFSKSDLHALIMLPRYAAQVPDRKGMFFTIDGPKVTGKSIMTTGLVRLLTQDGFNAIGQKESGDFELYKSERGLAKNRCKLNVSEGQREMVRVVTASRLCEGLPILVKRLKENSYVVYNHSVLATFAHHEAEGGNIYNLLQKVIGSYVEPDLRIILLGEPKILHQRALLRFGRELESSVNLPYFEKMCGAYKRQSYYLKNSIIVNTTGAASDKEDIRISPPSEFWQGILQKVYYSVREKIKKL